MKRIRILAVTIGLAALFVFPMAARAQFLFVDCSGTNPYAYPTINSALPNAGPGAFIAVTGTCNESVFLYGSNNLMLGAFFGQTATLNGNLSINNSQLVFVYGLNVTNPYGDGIDVNSSRSVVLDACNSGGYGIRTDNNSYVSIGSWGGITDISNNKTAALWIGQGSFSTIGNTHMANNAFTTNPGLRVAVDMRGGGKAQMG